MGHFAVEFAVVIIVYKLCDLFVLGESEIMLTEQKLK